MTCRAFGMGYLILPVLRAPSEVLLKGYGQPELTIGSNYAMHSHSLRTMIIHIGTGEVSRALSN